MMKERIPYQVIRPHVKNGFGGDAPTRSAPIGR